MKQLVSLFLLLAFLVVGGCGLVDSEGGDGDGNDGGGDQTLVVEEKG